VNIFHATIEGKNILDRSEKTQIALVFVVGVILSVVDLLVISLIYPIIRVISEKEESDSVINKVFDFAGITSVNGRVAGAFALISFAYLIRTFVFIIHKKFLARVRKNLFVRISKRLYGIYIDRNLEFFQVNNTSKLIRNIYGVATYLNNYVFGIMNFISEVLLGVGLLVVLLDQSVTSTLVIVVFCLIGTFSIYRLTKRMMNKAGEQVSEFTAKRYEVLQCGFDGISEIKIYDQQEKFKELYGSYHNQTAESERKFEFYSSVTSPIFELLIIVSLSTAMVLYLSLGSEPGTIIPMMAVYVAVAFRFIPSFSRIIGFFQQLEYGRAMAKEISADLSSSPIPEDSVLRTSKDSLETLFGFANDINIRNLSFSYEGSEQPIFSDANVTFEANKIHGLMGDSGVGKSTLAKLIIGLLAPNVGGIYSGSIDISHNLRDWHSKIGYVPQQVFMMDSTIADNITFGRNSLDHDRDEIYASIRSAGLSSFLEGNAQGIDYQVGERGSRLSGGQKQRVGIARALYRKPTLLVLDEATSGLDTSTEREIMDTIRDLDAAVTVIVVSHSLEVMKFCDTVSVIKDCKIYREVS
jgi:ABC-type multidrug transport system fused ATPase/permease subunit